MPALDLHIGSTVYLLDGHRYQRQRTLTPRVIAAETRVSWIVGDNKWNEVKFPKKPDRPDGKLYTIGGERERGERVYLDPSEWEQDCWTGKNAYRISQVVSSLKDYALLKQIAELVGYKESE